jgi:hypothetical protein
MFMCNMVAKYELIKLKTRKGNTILDVTIFIVVLYHFFENNLHTDSV